MIDSVNSSAQGIARYTAANNQKASDGKGRIPASAYDSTSDLLGYELHISREGKEQRAIKEAAMANRQELPVEYSFNEGTLTKLVSDNLEGKVDNAADIAIELDSMIRGTINGAATVEERAVNREMGLRHAEHIANTYFDNPDDAKAFLDEIYRFAQNDILREKGYRLIDNADIEPIKPYESSVSTPNGREISMEAYAKQAGYGSFREISNGAKNVEKFYSDFSKNKDDWSKAIIEDFEKKASAIDDIINSARNSLTDEQIAASLQKLLSA